MRPYHWWDNIIVGTNCLRPLLIASAAHLYVRESHKYKMHPISMLLASGSSEIVKYRISSCSKYLILLLVIKLRNVIFYSWVSLRQTNLQDIL